MKKKFKIMYPEDYWDKDKAGKPYLPGANKFVVMTGGGVFLLVDSSDYYTHVRKLSEVLHKYDVVWK